MPGFKLGVSRMQSKHLNLYLLSDSPLLHSLNLEYPDTDQLAPCLVLPHWKLYEDMDGACPALM